jgi:hypothetical protein
MKRWRKDISDLRRNAHHNTPLQNAVNSGEGFLLCCWNTFRAIARRGSLISVSAIG